MSDSSWSQPNEQSLDRVLAGEAEAEETAAVERWLETHRDEQLRLTAITQGLHRSAWHNTSNRMIESWIARATEIPAAVPPRTNNGVRSKKINRALRQRNIGWHRAAYHTAGLAALTLVLSVGARQFVSLGTTPSLSSSTNIYRTEAGEHLTVQLGNGNQAMLAPLTTLSMRHDRDGDRLDLHGEAHFTVTPDQRHSFSVLAGHTSIRVLGTTFDVRNYPDESAARITVSAGKVTVRPYVTRPIVLTAGMSGQIADSVVSIAPSQEVEQYTDWNSGELVFRKSPVPNMLATLRRWTGYSFELDDSTLTTQHVSATFTINDTEETLRRLKHVLGVNMTFRGSTIILRATATPAHTRHNERSMTSLSTEAGR